MLAAAIRFASCRRANKSPPDPSVSVVTTLPNLIGKVVNSHTSAVLHMTFTVVSCS